MTSGLSKRTTWRFGFSWAKQMPNRAVPAAQIDQFSGAGEFGERLDLLDCRLKAAQQAYASHPVDGFLVETMLGVVLGALGSVSQDLFQVDEIVQVVFLRFQKTSEIGGVLDEERREAGGGEIAAFFFRQKAQARQDIQKFFGGTGAGVNP